MGWKTDPLTKEPYQPELADAGCGRQLVEADVALGLVPEIVARRAKRPVIARCDRRSRMAHGRGALDESP